MNTGDIVRVTRKDGRIYDCFVIEDYKNRNMFYGRVLESSKDHVPVSSWSRYGLVKNGICQLKEECKSIKTVSKSKCIVVEDLSDTKVYRNVTPSNNLITFCLSEDFGGWSDEKDQDTAIFESYNSSIDHRKEVTCNA